MLIPVNMNRRFFDQGGADGIGANLFLVPVAAQFQMIIAPGINDTGIALCCDDMPAVIGQDKHRIGISQKKPGTLQGGKSGRNHIGAVQLVTVQVTFIQDRCLTAGDINLPIG